MRTFAPLLTAGTRAMPHGITRTARQNPTARGLVMRRHLRRLAGVLACGALALPAGAADHAMIDTQAQFDPITRKDPAQRDSAFPASLQTALARMDEYGVQMTLIVPPPFTEDLRLKYDVDEIVPVIAGHRDRFAFLGGGGTLNPLLLSTPPEAVTDQIKQRFREQCDRIMAAGALGFGEVTARHLALAATMGGRHPYESTAPDHPLLLLLADIAAEYDVPIDIHFDIFPRTIATPPRLQSPRNPDVLEANLSGFERLLAHNPKARFNWAHVGSDPGGNRNPALMRYLLARHPNLYSAFRVVRQGSFPVFPLDGRGRLKPKWRELILDFPDRFTMHSDYFFVPAGMPERGGPRAYELANKLLDQLPAPVARALAHENARRIYRLAERADNDDGGQATWHR